jgi:uncharacterized lipoprotein YehR (DUF1307 family)
MMKASVIFELMLALSLTACGDEAAKPGPGGVSAEDAKSLDQAAEKLDTEQTAELRNQ